MLGFSLFVVLCVIVSVFGFAPGSDIQVPSGYSLISSGKYGTKLYSIDVPSSVYKKFPMLIDLRGEDHYSQGYDMGLLLGNAVIESYNSLMLSMLGKEIWEPTVAKALGLLLDWQWRDYLSKQVPQDYIDELRGMTDGGFASGQTEDVGLYASRGIVMANLPGSLENFKYILEDEKENSSGLKNITWERAQEIILILKNKWSGVTCSMFGVWGSRTEAGHVYTGRNLDWLLDTGISNYKLITVHHPPKGYAHATVGWAGIWGAITGMSSQGITVHEANLESNDITFRGFPWVTRLRHVMSNAKNIDEALSIWNSTHNTVGFNHGFGSANDQKAVCLETMASNTAVFGANDPREQELWVNGHQIGHPRDDAVYRTNHGYDSYTVSHYMWNDTGAYLDSVQRYNAFPEAFDSYQSSSTLIAYKEAINITAILGHKSGESMYSCTGNYDGGSNILRLVQLVF